MYLGYFFSLSISYVGFHKLVRKLAKLAGVFVTCYWTTLRAPLLPCWEMGGCWEPVPAWWQVLGV